VTRHPAAPGAEIDRADLAEHLASCLPCASRAEHDAVLIRAWDATRPAEPTDAAWDAVWARLSNRLDRAAERPASLRVTSPPRTGRWNASAAFYLAQAAAVLAILVVWGTHRRPPAETNTGPGPGLTKTVNIEPGEVVMIHLDGGDFRAVALGYEPPRWDAIDENLVLFNDAEAMAGMHETIADIHHDVHSAPPPG
jgi:hypothetical protein